ncbi:MAG: GTP-binding protein, partial [Rhodospirillales bacterium]|nr:GTP-binding protein [Rhodospirillales bacterium]
LNHLTRQPGMESIALIINEFGEIGLDNLLVETAIENTLLLENGCICCSVRGDLIDTVNDLFAKVRNDVIPDFSRIVIETTGLAEPGPIVNTLLNERVVASRCRLDNVVSLIDGVQGKMQAQKFTEAMKQITQADIGLISKRDLISEADAAALESFVTEINPALRMAEIEHGQVSLDMLFGHSNKYGGLSLSPLPETVSAHDHSHDHSSEHRHGDVSTWSFVGSTPLDRGRLFVWLQMLYSLRASHMLRLKGLVRLDGYSDPILLQAVGPVLGDPLSLTEWPGDEEKTRLVLITQGLTESSLSLSFERYVLDIA